MDESVPIEGRSEYQLPPDPPNLHVIMTRLDSEGALLNEENKKGSSSRKIVVVETYISVSQRLERNAQ